MMGNWLQQVFLTNNGTDDDFALVRYYVDGSVDNTFGTNGIVITPISDTDNRARSQSR